MKLEVFAFLLFIFSYVRFNNRNPKVRFWECHHDFMSIYLKPLKKMLGTGNWKYRRWTVEAWASFGLRNVHFAQANSLWLSVRQWVVLVATGSASFLICFPFSGLIWFFFFCGTVARRTPRRELIKNVGQGAAKWPKFSAAAWSNWATHYVVDYGLCIIYVGQSVRGWAAKRPLIGSQVGLNVESAEPRPSSGYF